MKKIMVIGYGAMARNVLANLPSDISLGYLLVRPEKVAQVQKEVGSDIQVAGRFADFSGRPDLVLEMAGQAGLKMHMGCLMDAGLDVGVISVGAFADSDFEREMVTKAKANNGRIFILAGAVAGMDGLASAKLAGLTAVTYQGRKPPQGWKGSYAESLVDLDNITESVVFFKGTAREAATLFPANSNVAATIALSGIGMDDTLVELIADPSIGKNQHCIEAVGAFGEMSISMKGNPLPDNPKTSMLAALSVRQFCQQLINPLIL